jgi:diaminohydroxyphosphoribosylaminopyrimidine deaminase / 5-amino-6-(5-phosphoribosylamino)uracil reductase
VTQFVDGRFGLLGSRAEDPRAPTHERVVVSAERAWQLLLTLAARARARRPLCHDAGYAWRKDSLHVECWVEVPEREAELWVEPARRGVRALASHHLPHEVEQLCALLLPLVVGPRSVSLVLGHLGQSLDGRVATPTGCSQFITGREDVVHTHRLRALFDAVIVGVRTVQLDDPQLTTRHVTGQHPTRVVLDPQGKLRGPFKVLEDGAASTLVFTSRERISGRARLGCAEWVGLDCRDGRFDFVQLRKLLAERGLSRLFVEGGGVTVSRFLAGRALDRLHVSVAPMILGSGAPAFALPPIDQLDEALSPSCRHFTLGSDVLFDCEFAPSQAAQ